MSFRNFLIAYPITAIIFLGLDAVWLNTMADRLYRPALGDMMMERFSPAPAIVFYVIYIVGVVVFCVAPAVNGRAWLSALGSGALLGLVAYATYDLTNQATLKNWPLQVTLADLCWGTFATALSAAAATWVTSWISDFIARR